MDFSIPESLRAMQLDVRQFMAQRVIPNEDLVLEQDRHGEHTALIELQQAAKSLGLWTPHLPPDLGGQGLGVMGMCVLFREMGRSLIGARVFHCDAPDQGNMELLSKAASPPIRCRYLEPLVRGEITSAFCMTEPAPGAGADPSLLRTTARWDGHRWVLDGHKWYSTGAGDAAFLIVVARTSSDRKSGATMFVVDRHAEGVTHIRDIPTMAEPILAHREAELRFDRVQLEPDAVLGDVGQGFELAQTRLVPARLTHCMRWLGLADRALTLCREYLGTRSAFGKPLADHQMVQLKIAEGATSITAGNLLTFYCAGLLERGEMTMAKAVSSMAKTQVARTLCSVLDDAIQLHGGKGYSDDLPFAKWYRHARAARIADGPDEVHQMVIAREFLRGRLSLLGE